MIAFLMILFTVSVLIGTLLVMLMLIGSSIYDVSAIQEKNNPSKISKSARTKYRPTVSVILPAFNESAVIERCLDNLSKVRYKRLQIIVSDDKSTDNTRQLVRTYIARFPEKDIILVAKRQNGGRGSAINSGLRRAKGEIVVAFDIDCLVKPNAIRKMVNHFADPDVSAVAANIRIIDTNTVLSLMQRMEYLVSFRSKKFNTITNSEVIIGGAGASYRASVLKKAGGFDDRMKTEDIELSMRMTKKLGKFGGLRYASDYVIYTEAVPTYKALFKQRFRWKFGSLQALFFNRSLLFSTNKNQNFFLTWVRLPFALWSEVMLMLEPFFLVLFVYLAFVGNNPILFIGAASSYSVVTWLAIWSDEHLSMKDRFRLTAMTPTMYLSSFIMSAVQVSAIFRCFVHGRELTSPGKHSGAYVTTQRSTQKLELTT